MTEFIRIQSHEIQMGEFMRFISSKFQAFSFDPLFDPTPSACCRTEGAADIFMELPATAAVGCGRQSPAPGQNMTNMSNEKHWLRQCKMLPSLIKAGFSSCHRKITV